MKFKGYTLNPFQVQAAKAGGTAERVSVAELAQRVSNLEAEVAELREQLKTSP